MKRVAVLGSTGSIGSQTLDVIASQPERLVLAGVAARSRMERLADQVRRFSPAHVVVWDADKALELRRQIARDDVWTGCDGLTRLATHPDVDIVVVATSGRDALVPLVRAIQAGKRIALASKELLVMAGCLLMRLVQEHGSSLVPIDSEHAALLQCLQGVPKAQVAELIITGSGGPLWGRPASARQTVSLDEVLAHPKWQMGPKITVDSATLMNKGLELIEARWLFDMPFTRLRVVIHPEAAIHALVRLVDGSLLAQLAPCDMRLPIQYALSVPERWPTTLPRLDLARLGGLRFQEPDLDEFPCLKLAMEAAAAGEHACVVLNAANDTAVHAYLEGTLAFGDMPRLIRDTLERATPVAHPSLDEILALDAWARTTASELIPQCSPR